MGSSIAPAAERASAFARIALANVGREYPAKLDHVMESPADVRGPRELHPAFFGSFDWHSCVHMHWLLARLRKMHPALPERAAIDDAFDRHLTRDNVAAECAYLARPASLAFERTYGWAWLLALSRELRSTRWSETLAPLADAIVQRYVDYLPRQRYPLRHGLHANSAFGLVFAMDYAHPALRAACDAAARRWFETDRDVPAAWEPSGTDFLSPSLTEADLMRRVLAREDFSAWLDAFLPRLADGAPASLFTPVVVDDRSDGQLVHLDGLNFARAWSMRSIASALPPQDRRAGALRRAADAHEAAGLAGLASEDYGGRHWLATFAVLAATVEHANRAT